MPNVVITEFADFWVTFVGEGVGYCNVFGCCSYGHSNPYYWPSRDEEITIFSSKVSAFVSGGYLEIWEKMFLRVFLTNIERRVDIDYHWLEWFSSNGRKFDDVFEC